MQSAVFSCVPTLLHVDLTFHELIGSYSMILQMTLGTISIVLVEQRGLEKSGKVYSSYLRANLGSCGISSKQRFP